MRKQPRFQKTQRINQHTGNIASQALPTRNIPNTLDLQECLKSQSKDPIQQQQPMGKDHPERRLLIGRPQQLSRTKTYQNQ